MHHDTSQSQCFSERRYAAVKRCGLDGRRGCCPIFFFFQNVPRCPSNLILDSRFLRFIICPTDPNAEAMHACFPTLIMFYFASCPWDFRRWNENSSLPLPRMIIQFGHLFTGSFDSADALNLERGTTKGSTMVRSHPPISRSTRGALIGL